MKRKMKKTMNIWLLLGASLLTYCGDYSAGSSGAAYISPATKNIPVVQTPVPEIPVEKADVIVFATSMAYTGDLVKAMGGIRTAREAADELCEMDRTLAMEDRQIRAMISINSSDQIADMPLHFGLPIDKPFVGDLDIELAVDFSDLLDGEISSSMEFAVSGIASGERFWTGSLADGTAEAENCAEWKSEIDSGVVGSSSATDAQWLASGVDDCAETRKLICLAF